MKIAFVNAYDARDIKMWSGIPYHIVRVVEKLLNTEVVCTAIPIKRTPLSYVKGLYFNRLLKKNYLYWADPGVHKKYTTEVQTATENKFDLIITFQFNLVDGLKNGNTKVIYWNDATFQNLVNFYGYATNLCSYSLKTCHKLQKQSFDKADLSIFSSSWAIQSAINFYKINANKLKEIPFASNLTKAAEATEVIPIINNRANKSVSLLFLAVDWERKGGDVAVEIIEALISQGINASLIVAGTTIPEKHNTNKNIISKGFINKNEQEGEARIIELLKTSSFLILPTLADCTPVVFSEAGSYALPVITTNVGGIASIVVNGVNGFCFDLADFKTQALSVIHSHLPGSEAYENLSKSSYEHYNKNFTWSNVQQKVTEVLEDLQVL